MYFVLLSHSPVTACFFLVYYNIFIKAVEPIRFESLSPVVELIKTF